MVEKKQQVYSDGLYELTEGAKTELQSSPYYNEDLAPVRKNDRSWNTYHIATLWMGMCIAISTWMLASSGIALGLSWWQSLLNIFLANVIILVPMQLNSHAGTKYGIPFPVFARLSFGIKGAHLASLARGIVGAMWFGVQCWLGGAALNAVLGAIIPGWMNWNGGIWISYLIFSLICTVVAYRGSKAIKFMESWGVPILGVLGLFLMIWGIVAVGDAGKRIVDVFNMPATYEPGQFWGIFLATLTGNLGFWATMALNIPDFSRFAKSQKTQLKGQIIGLPATMLIIGFMSIFVTGCSLIVFGEMLWDPTSVIVKIGSPFASILGCLGIVIAQVTTNVAANIVAPANGFSNLFPKKITYSLGVLIAAAISVIIMPWRLLASPEGYIFNFLGTYAIYLGPLAGIYIADYYIVKKRRVDAYSLFVGEKGRYWYKDGFNMAAIWVWIISVVPPTIGLLFPQNAFFKSLFDNGWMFGFILSMIIYPLFIKKDDPSILSEKEEESITTHIDDKEKIPV
jgi:NCS1 family nucleobase:cation symporter-1